MGIRDMLGSLSCLLSWTCWASAFITVSCRTGLVERLIHGLVRYVLVSDIIENVELVKIVPLYRVGERGLQGLYLTLLELLFFYFGLFLVGRGLRIGIEDLVFFGLIRVLKSLKILRILLNIDKRLEFFILSDNFAFVQI